jgi:protein-tyrosine phosphatase
MARRADLILVMEQIHRRHLSGLAPAAFGKVRLLDEPRDIPDPYRQPLAAFRAALAQIERGADAWSARLWRQ